MRERKPGTTVGRPEMERTLRRGGGYGESEDELERNVDKIKRLDHELGRYRKKVADQDRELKELRRELEEACAGNRETQDAVDAVLTAVTLAHGVQAEDPDAGEAIGWRLAVPYFDIREMRETYEIHARRDEETASYVLGVASRRRE